MNESSDRLVYFNESFGVYHNYTQKPHATSWASLVGNASFEKMMPSGRDPNAFLAGGYQFDIKEMKIM